MNEIRKKLTSRKFWACMAGVAAGLAAVFGLDEGVITEMAGMITTLASVVSYIWAEGRVDAAHAKADRAA